MYSDQVSLESSKRLHLYVIMIQVISDTYGHHIKLTKLVGKKFEKNATICN